MRWPVSSSDLRSLRTPGQPPPCCGSPPPDTMPATRRALGVMGDGHRADAALVLRDLVGEAHVRLGRRIGAEQRVPGLHQLARRIALDDFADDDRVGEPRRLHLGARLVVVLAAGLQLIGGAAAITVAFGPFGLGDRVPDRRGACDVVPSLIVDAPLTCPTPTAAPALAPAPSSPAETAPSATNYPWPAR
jgi:hypothetical protein